MNKNFFPFSIGDKEADDSEEEAVVVDEVIAKPKFRVAKPFL